ncbi:GNAT family N-acetyltransferase [Streptomyces sp. B6B3]|uniref:GNAT family N-acetyltransferase n=1 Tax=Streptomyces sp. B6B3 TaxID=3153570 RepID=UPI00325CCE6D
MEIVDRFGLRLALIEPAELDREPWTRTDRPLDVVRMPNPPARLWDELARRGFVRKPAVVTWAGDAGPDDDAYLAGLGRYPRRAVRRARRDARRAGLRETVEDPVTPRSLDRFLELYRERVGAMRFGVPFALDYRDAVLHGPRRFFGVFAWEGDELAGGCLVLECPAVDTLVLRFSAVSARWRRASLARVLYLTALAEGRRRGYTRATLGNEPNLLGHLTRPGLLVFKSELGFRPVPSHEFADPGAQDEADLVLRLDSLADPALILGYPDPTTPHAEARLVPHVFHVTPVDATRYTAPNLAPPILHPVPRTTPATAGR